MKSSCEVDAVWVVKGMEVYEKIPEEEAVHYVVIEGDAASTILGNLITDIVTLLLL